MPPRRFCTGSRKPRTTHSRASPATRLVGLVAVVLVIAVANAIAIGAIDEARLDTDEMNVVCLDHVRPMFADPFGEVVVAGGEPGRSSSGQPRRVKVIREVLLAIALADGIDVRSSCVRIAVV